MPAASIVPGRQAMHAAVQEAAAAAAAAAPKPTSLHFGRCLHSFYPVTEAAPPSSRCGLALTEPHGRVSLPCSAATLRSRQRCGPGARGLLGRALQRKPATTALLNRAVSLAALRSPSAALCHGGRRTAARSRPVLPTPSILPSRALPRSCIRRVTAASLLGWAASYRWPGAADGAAAVLA